MDYEHELSFGDTPLTLAYIAELQVALDVALSQWKVWTERAERAEAQLAAQRAINAPLLEQNTMLHWMRLEVHRLAPAWLEDRERYYLSTAPRQVSSKA